MTTKYRIVAPGVAGHEPGDIVDEADLDGGSVGALVAQGLAEPAPTPKTKREAD